MIEKKWTTEEIDRLKDIYPYLSNSQISLILDRTIASIQHKACRLGLKKDREANKVVRSIARSEIYGSNWKGGRKKNKKGRWSNK